MATLNCIFQQSFLLKPPEEEPKQALWPQFVEDGLLGGNPHCSVQSKVDPVVVPCDEVLERVEFQPVLVIRAEPTFLLAIRLWMVTPGRDMLYVLLFEEFLELTLSFLSFSSVFICIELASSVSVRLTNDG